jgi:hypothetical protein
MTVRGGKQKRCSQATCKAKVQFLPAASGAKVVALATRFRPQRQEDEMKRTMNIAIATAVLATAGAALAQQSSPVVHANKGQSAERQSRDEGTCHTLARKKTGVDPVVMAENSTPLQPGKGITSEPIAAPSTAMGSSGGGATGSGDMGGQAGAGATGSSSGGATGSSSGVDMGASGSTSAGASGMHPEKKSSQLAQGSSGTAGTTGQGGPAGSGKHKPQQFSMAHSADSYNRVFAQCMTGRGYTVENTAPSGAP